MYFDPAFSVYETINKQHPGNIFITELNYMYHLSRVIERDIIEQKLDAPFYVGLQSSNNLLPILERYRKIAEITLDTHTFGIPSTRVSPPLGLNLVPIADYSKLAKEWFLVINHPDYKRILSAKEVGLPTNVKSERQFEAILTSEPDVVEHVAQTISEALMPYALKVN